MEKFFYGERILPFLSLSVVEMFMFKYFLRSIATPKDLVNFPEFQNDFPNHSFSHLLISLFVECVSWSRIVSIFLFVKISKSLSFFNLQTSRLYLEIKQTSECYCPSCHVPLKSLLLCLTDFYSLFLFLFLPLFDLFCSIRSLIAWMSCWSCFCRCRY